MPLDPRQAYFNGLLQDVRYHNSTDAYSDCDIFPDTVKEYITLLHDAFQLPTWVKEVCCCKLYTKQILEVYRDRIRSCTSGSAVGAGIAAFPLHYICL